MVKNDINQIRGVKPKPDVGPEPPEGETTQTTIFTPAEEENIKINFSIDKLVYKVNGFFDGLKEAFEPVHKGTAIFKVIVRSAEERFLEEEKED
jgi:hypothetical protein